MQTTPNTKADWLAELERVRLLWEELLAEADPAWYEIPGANGDWTFKDVAAHLNSWRAWTVERLEAAVRDEAPLHPLSEETEEGVEALNRSFYERDRNRPAAEVIAESREQFRRMRLAVEAVPEVDLLAPGRFPWLDGYPLSAVLAGSFEHLRVDHEPAIRAWLQARTGDVPSPG